MKSIDMDKLEQAINSSPALSAVVNELEKSIADEMGENNIGIDPFLILMLISVIIQVARFCQERNKQTDDVIVAALTGLDKLPLRRTIVLRRRVDKAWVEYCRNRNISATAPNPLLGALRTISNKMTAETAQEFVAVAKTV